MLCDVVRRRRRRWAHAPAIHAASHFGHKKRVAWVPISMHTCCSFFYNYGAPLGGPSGRRSSATIRTIATTATTAPTATMATTATKTTTTTTATIAIAGSTATTPATRRGLRDV